MQKGRAQQHLAVVGDPESVSEPLGNQVLAHRVALHVAVDLARGGAQRFERQGLGVGADELVRTPPMVSPHTPPSERTMAVRYSYTTCHWGLSARSCCRRGQVWTGTGAGCGDSSGLPGRTS